MFERENKISSPKEISKLGVLPNLRILVLSGNPVTQIRNYRQDVIGRLPNLERLDKEAVTKEEREEAEAYMLSQTQQETKEEPADPAAEP